MLGAATFINPLLKVATAVAILAAVYFFAVRPVLDTTEKAIDTVNPVLESSQRQIDRALRRAERAAPGTQSFEYQVTGPPKVVRRVVDCIQRAAGDAARIQACVR